MPEDSMIKARSVERAFCVLFQRNHETECIGKICVYFSIVGSFRCIECN